MQREAIRALYRRCLRAAVRCRNRTGRDTMWRYAQLKFRSNQGVNDPARLRALFAEAEEHVASLTEYQQLHARGRSPAATPGLLDGLEAGPEPDRQPGRAEAKDQPSAGNRIQALEGALGVNSTGAIKGLMPRLKRLEEELLGEPQPGKLNERIEQLEQCV